MEPIIDYQEFNLPPIGQFWVAHVRQGGFVPSTFAAVNAAYTGVAHGSSYAAAHDPVDSNGEMSFNVWATELGGKLDVTIDGVVQAPQRVTFSKVLTG